MENDIKAPSSAGTSLKEGVNGMFSYIKGPVFWVAAGYIVCKFMDRKK